jgi:hypothetical protein
MKFAVVNPTLNPIEVTLTARAYDGSLILNNRISNPITVTLAAAGQKALSPEEAFGPGMQDQDGWIELSDPSGASKGLFLLHDAALTFIDGAEFSSNPSHRLVFANITSTTELALVNTSAETVEGLVYLYRNSGELAHVDSITLHSLSGMNGTISALVPGASGFTGYAVVETLAQNSTPQNALIGIETYRNHADIAILRGLPESATLRTGYLPHFATRSGYLSTLTMVNTSGKPQRLKITAEGLEVNGQPRTPSAVTVERTIRPHARLQESTNTLFALSGSATITGHVRFETMTDTLGVMAVMEISTTDGVLLSAIEAQNVGYSDFYFLHVAENEDFHTGVVLLNTNNEPSIVTITAFDRSGAFSNSTVVNLAPGERASPALADLIHKPSNLMGSYARITATRPILALEFLEWPAGARFLASVPAQGINLIPQISGTSVGANQGAHVISDDSSASLLIPPQALKSDTAIKVTPLKTATLPPPAADQRAISRVEGLPAGTKFDIPVQLTFPLDIDLVAGTQLPLMIYTPTTGLYETTPFVATVDKSGRTASAAVTHFTEYVAALGLDVLSITSVTPSTVLAGNTVTIIGEDFSPNTYQDVVTFAGPSNTSIVAQVISASPTSITAVVPAGAVTGNVVVRVDTRSSNGVPVTVISPNPAPGTIYVTPSPITPSGSYVDLQVSGTSFVSSSVVNYDSNPLPTTFVNSTLLTVRLSGALLNAGVHQVKVVSPAPGGGTSNIVSVTVNSQNQAPTANAGPDQTITFPASATLNGTASDDGSPAGSTLTTAWSKVSGPGTVTFGNIAARSTTASFSLAGAYVLRLTATDGVLSTADTISISVNSGNQAPTVNAGSDQSVTLPARAMINGTASDDGLPTGSILSTTWSKVSGPGTVVFDELKALSTSASFSVGGTYVLRLSATDGTLTTTDDMIAIVNSSASSTNQAPSVNAGPDQTISLLGSVSLNGTAADDGLPTGSTLSTTWSKVSGPGTVSFGSVSSRTTTANFSVAGSYVLNLTASDSLLTATDTVTVVVNATTAPTGNSVAAGAVTLSSTFENISVRAKFSGDPNNNATGKIRFRPNGQSVWRDAFTPIVDRRPTIGGVVNRHAFEARGSIVGLTAGTTYEVEFTWIDPDGVSGNPIWTGLVTTIAPSAPVSGRMLYVDDIGTNGNGSSTSPFNSIPAAINAAISGDTIFVRTGTYPPFTVSKSGTASGYIAIVGEARDQVLINGGANNNIDVTASYIQLKNLRLRQSSHSSVNIKLKSHHVWVENLYHENVSSSFSYNDSGVLVEAGSHNVYVLNNFFYSQSLTNYTYPGVRWDSPGTAIYLMGYMDPQGTFVLKGNVINGGFRDGIGNTPENWAGGTVDNSDVANNTITGVKDDGIQLEGDDVNLRIYGNDITHTNGYAAIAMSPNIVGPAYVYRNVIKMSWGGAGGSAFKLLGDGYGFYFHNTIDTSASTQRHDAWAGAGPNQYIYNNIIKTSGNPVYSVSSSGKYNGNLYSPKNANYPVVSRWGGTTDYMTVTAFRNATGNEQQGRQGDPLFTDAAKRINSSSPAFNGGILIPNFNSADSAWPYAGTAPDMGAYEVGGIYP